jgi:hypothetical protein
MKKSSINNYTNFKTQQIMNKSKSKVEKTAKQFLQKCTSLNVLFAFLLLLSSNVMGQNNISVAGRNYVKYGNTWFLLWGAAQDTFRVDTAIITIKFHESVSSTDITNFETQNQLTKIRQNDLKFIDYQIPSLTNVFDFVQNIALPSSLIESVDINTLGRWTIIPNDPGFTFGALWFLDQASNVDINAPEAWNITTGCPNVTVAIIDAGTDVDHEELGFGTDNYQNIHLNPGEDPWILGVGNGVDDDGNGYIDDWKGWDFYQGDKNALPSLLQDHGTSVAGFVSCKTNNNKGFSGIAGGWNNPGTGLVICRVGDWAPNGAVLDDAILYAAKIGVKIIQMSLTVPQTAAIDAALQLAYQNAGIFIVCAAGNGNGPPVLYPANNQYVFSVAATGMTDLKASFSSYGTDLDLAAPGEYLSTIGNWNTGYCFNCGSGTSFAAPLVSGTASLMLCVNPCLTNKQVEDILKNTANKVGGYNYNWDATRPGHSQELGYGRLDAYQAVLAAQQMYVAPPTVDLYTKDTPNDWGVEPNPNTGPMWISDDIWVRKQADGFINQVHQNPEYWINPLIDNYVYVRIRNKSCTNFISTPSDLLHLHWAKAATALSWPSYWDGTAPPCAPSAPMGNEVLSSPQQIPNIPAGGEAILEFPWHVPDPALYSGCNTEPWHFCLLSRIVSPQDPMTFPEVASVYDNTRNDNNIAWKNVTVVDSLPGIAHNEDCYSDRQVGGVIAVGNPFDADDNYKLEFKLDDKNRGTPIFEQAEIKITLDDLTWQKWAAGGYQSDNIRIKRDDCKQLVVTGNPASLKNLTYAAQERSTINLSFNFLTDKVDATPQFDYHVIQRRSQDDKIIGGELYQIRKPTRYLFGADAGGDKNISEGTSTTLTANSIGESAYYNWYDTDGNLIYSGNNFTVTPEITKKYKLEVIALSDGFASYDSVTVKIKDCEIQSITPNPATTQIVVQYKAQNVSSGYLVITHPSGTPNDNFILNLSQNTKTINVSNYAAGNYNLILICDGEIKDTKVLSIQ